MRMGASWRLMAPKGVIVCVHVVLIIFTYRSQASDIQTIKPQQQQVSSNLTLKQTITNSDPITSINNCTTPCSTNEFSNIIQRLSQNDDTISSFLLGKKANNNNNNNRTNEPIRSECLVELIGLIRNLANDELEMKSVLEFASGTNPIPRGGAKLTSARQQVSPSQQVANNTSQCKRQETTSLSPTINQQQDQLLAVTQETEPNAIETNKSKVLPKVVAKVTHYIDSLERFTLTREWASLLRVFRGVESILSLFVSQQQKQQQQQPQTTTPSTSQLSSLNATTGRSTTLINLKKPSTTNTTNLASPVNATTPSPPSPPSPSTTTTTTNDILKNLKANLPREVQTLTDSLTSLFPWHVWPWNNIDLYTTAETFLNHGIFAFSKTTSGPERRIDYLADLLKTLFKSLKFDSFPKKCADWSKVICEPEKFYKRLVLALPDDVTTDQSIMKLNATNPTDSSKSLLVGELTCIMFSSLSMKQFGATANDRLEEPLVEGQLHQVDELNNNNNKLTISKQNLAWDKIILKGLRLYGLAREALTDQQWSAQYKLVSDLWQQEKISDRVIMVGRVIQLLTSCHMPKEMLESALWKDIYKYKNALNQMSDIVIEELNRSSENGKFTLEQLSLSSSHLNDIFAKLFKLMPKLIESLTKTIVDQLPELINKFFSDKLSFYQGPCKGSSLSELVPNLEAHKDEILQLEEAICAQLNTKPNFSMMQINNLTNELLSMAFNFSNFGNAFAIPEFLTQFNPMTIPTVSSNSQLTTSSQSTNDTKIQQANVTSIIDELVTNPRLAAIVAILQSSPLDPPEVHAELPELDWVEASTSVALFYESIQRLMSFEGQFVIFPEVENFQDLLMSSADKSRQSFRRFAKRDPIRLLAYALDSAMPIALRTFKPMDSFYSECQSTLRDLFSQIAEVGQQDQPDYQAGFSNGLSKESRQWQCVVSSLNFGAHALNKLIGNFNSMLENVLAQASFLITSGDLNVSPNNSNNSSNRTTEASCLLFDGSLARLLDQWPQVMELALESLLVASTQTQPTLAYQNETNQSSQPLNLLENICNFNYSLDPFSSAREEDVRGTRVAMCRLASKSTLTNCANVLKLTDWKATMKELNGTWFESSAVSVEPAFRATTKRVHEFFILFGRAKPNNWSESLLARILNVNSFWDILLNKTVQTIESYHERKFELGLQTMEPILHDNLMFAMPSSELARQVLITSIGSANALLSHLNLTQKQQTTIGSNSSSIEFKVKSILKLADDHALVMVETLLQTVASNLTQLELLFSKSSQDNYQDCVWKRFCEDPIEKYFYFDNSTSDDHEMSNYNQANSTRNDLCKFDWFGFKNQLDASVSDKLKAYPTRHLTRVTLTKWGQAFDLLSSSKVDIGKFAQVSYWQPLSAKLSLITPLKEQPSNFIWIWDAIERLLSVALESQQQQQQQQQEAGGETSKVIESLTRSIEQLNCALDSVKGGLSWDNLANIYAERQDILAAHSTINNGFLLASIGVRTFMAPKKFQRLLDEFVRPAKRTLQAIDPSITTTITDNSTNSNTISTSGNFCEMRDHSKWETILALPSEDQDAGDLPSAISSFQELICDTNFDSLPQSVNPISTCYSYVSSNNSNNSSSGVLAESIDRAFKLTSLAIMDSKMVVVNDVRPPILDKSQWANFWDWWSQQPAAEPRGGLALALVRAFQTLDSMNSAHVVWRAIFKSIHELSETLAFLTRAAEQQQQVAIAANKSLPTFGSSSSSSLTTTSNNNNNKTFQDIFHSQHLMSTISSLVFPEASNLIPLKTFKQLRQIKSIADYFSSTPSAQDSICSQLINKQTLLDDQSFKSSQNSVELINFKLNTNAKLNQLLCHYHATQWLTALNIIISAKTCSLTKRVDYMTKYLSTFTRQYKDYDQLDAFIHARQMDNIEQVSNATISHLLVASYSFRGSMSLSKLSNITWSSLPTILNTIDAQLCDNSQAEFGLHNFKQLINFYNNRNNNNHNHNHNDKNHQSNSTVKLEENQLIKLASKLNSYKPSDLDNLICSLPNMNMSLVFNYIRENFDLQKMISLVTTQPILLLQQFQESNSKLTTLIDNQQQQLSSSSSKVNCVTPFKLAAKWIQFGQDSYNHLRSKSSRDKVRKCLKRKKPTQGSLGQQSLNYMSQLNKMLNTINHMTSTNSWSRLRKTWNSISFYLLNSNSSSTLINLPARQPFSLPLQTLPTLPPLPTLPITSLRM